MPEIKPAIFMIIVGEKLSTLTDLSSDSMNKNIKF